jgi:hypothetical protein
VNKIDLPEPVVKSKGPSAAMAMTYPVHVEPSHRQVLRAKAQTGNLAVNGDGQGRDQQRADALHAYSPVAPDLSSRSSLSRPLDRSLVSMVALREVLPSTAKASQALYTLSAEGR